MVKSLSERIEIRTKDPLRILAIGDLHAPFSDTKKIGYILDFAKDFKPSHIVQIGDLYDQYTHSKYPKSANVMTPLDEDNEARAYAEVFWDGLAQKAPKAQRFQLKGNHCVRAYKRVLEKAPDLERAITTYYQQLYSFKGVKTLADDRSELVINDILFIHGYLANLGDHVRYNRQSTVVGHSHRGGVHFMRHNGSTLFELNCGHVADDTLLPFSYTPQRTNFWTAGFGVIETLKNGVVAPRFIPL